MKLSEMINTIYLLPAYGRVYKTAEQALQDWRNGKDFKMYNGPYCSIREIQIIKDTNVTVKILFDVNTDAIEI